MIGHHTNGKLSLLHCSQHHQVHHHAEDVDGDDQGDVDAEAEGMNVGREKVEPENSEGHLSNDNQAAPLHLTERVKQAAVVVVQADC